MSENAFTIRSLSEDEIDFCSGGFAILGAIDIGPGESENWAPVNLNLGVGDSKTYVSIFQNLPTSTAKLDFNVEILPQP